eukprot:72133-Pyramimonas_sp.AAC.1
MAASGLPMADKMAKAFDVLFDDCPYPANLDCVAGATTEQRAVRHSKTLRELHTNIKLHAIFLIGEQLAPHGVVIPADTKNLEEVKLIMFDTVKEKNPAAYLVY